MHAYIWNFFIICVIVQVQNVGFVFRVFFFKFMLLLCIFINWSFLIINLLNFLTCSLLCQNVILNTGGENIYSRSHCTWYLTIPSDQNKAQINLKVSYFATYFIFYINNESNTYHNMGSFINSVDFFYNAQVWKYIHKHKGVDFCQLCCMCISLQWTN